MRAELEETERKNLDSDSTGSSKLYAFWPNLPVHQSFKFHTVQFNDKWKCKLSSLKITS